MVIGARIFTGDVLARLGLDNLFSAGPGRYPRVEPAAIRAAAPDLALLPGEPYPFTAATGRSNSPSSTRCLSRADC
jgi:ABC-type Fe3+-hydroxamate transport system substrate-binding protein